MNTAFAECAVERLPENREPLQELIDLMETAFAMQGDIDPPSSALHPTPASLAGCRRPTSITFRKCFA
jgi:hypothetical protein